MKLLIVSSYRDFRNDGIIPYVKEQTLALCSLGVECEHFLVRGKGIRGYLREIPRLRKYIQQTRPDIIHAHYGLSGLLANLATRRIPVVVTYHGSDINVAKARKYSKLAIRLSAWNIFVSKRSMALVRAVDGKKCSLIPCGVALSDDQLQTREEARSILGWNKGEKKVLFAGMYADAVKGPDLAKQAIRELENEGMSAELVELRGYNREEVNRLMCAADCILMTSKTEGSPQAIKEAMACGCPIVSVNVGDVAERIEGIEGCILVPTRNPKDIANALRKAIAFEGKTKGREKVLNDGLSNEQVAARIIEVYERFGIRDYDKD